MIAKSMLDYSWIEDVKNYKFLIVSQIYCLSLKVY